MNRDRTLEYALTVVVLTFWTVMIAHAVTQRLPPAKFGILFLGGTLVVYVISELRRAMSEGDTVSAVLLSVSGVVSVAMTGYMFYNFEVLQSVRIGYALPEEYALSVAFIVVISYLTYRAYGGLFLGVLLGAILYGLFGSYVPGVLGHGGITPQRMVRILTLEMNGFFGLLVRLVGAWLALFLLYAGLLQAYGGFDLMIRIAVRSARYVRSGVAQSAVISSMILGSINGNTAANTAMTGSFTIPLMKRHGMSSETAGGVESVASTVGQVLPPVMGATAFIMASLLGIEYIDVVVAGILPALVLVVSIAVGVHYASIRQLDSSPDLEGLVEGQLTRTEALLEATRFGVPFVVLVYTLGVARFTVITAALYTAVAMFVTGVGFPLATALRDGDSTVGTLRTGAEETVEGARIGAISLAGIAIIIAAINGVVTVLLTTGVPSAITLALMDLSGGVMLVAVVLAMVISLILGLGMPTAAAYLIVALLIAPTLINQFGVPTLAAHFFVFYCAILAAVTPPIATSVAVATGIANSNFWGTSREALKISAPLFVLPFAFVYNSELVVGGITVETLWSAALALVGALAITHGLNFDGARFNRRHFSIGTRLLFVSLGVVSMAYPGAAIRLGAAAVFTVLVVAQRRYRPSTNEFTVSTPTAQ
ncbi:MAG: TRAP transporter 4TM/12TM fusion protein [Natronomonas sp.]|jgi:TRAP transporter 4TM/12TM fusion protein